MTNRIRLLILVCTSTATFLVSGPPVSASPHPDEPHPDERHCVSIGELDHVHEGQTRRKIEVNWDVRGRSHWVALKSTPEFDTYSYTLCGRRAADTDLYVSYLRGTRVWVGMETDRLS